MAIWHDIGDNHTGFGVSALAENQAGDGNPALGRDAGVANVSGSDNTFVGRERQRHFKRPHKRRGA